MDRIDGKDTEVEIKTRVVLVKSEPVEAQELNVNDYTLEIKSENPSKDDDSYIKIKEEPIKEEIDSESEEKLSQFETVTWKEECSVEATPRKNYICKTCSKTYTTSWGLQCHISVHGIRKYFCDICHKTFSVQQNLIKHQRLHIPVYDCKQCGMVFENKNALVNHLQVHNDKKVYTCKQCGNCFQLPTFLKRHCELYCNKDLTCEICSQTFKTHESLVTHLQSHVGNDNKYKCFDCGKSFYQRGALIKHRYLKCERVGSKPTWRLLPKPSDFKPVVNVKSTQGRVYKCKIIKWEKLERKDSS